MADDEWLKLPTEEKVEHKAWKARVTGYEEAMKLFAKLDDPKSQEFWKYLGLLKKFVTDSNAVALEKGLDAALAYLENAAPSISAKSCGEVLSGTIAKTLTARARTKEKGQEVVMMYIELEKTDIVMEELLKGLGNKNPKLVAACVETLRMAVRDFGSKIFQLKPLVKMLSGLLEDRDKNVREETKALTVEIYRWVGPAIKPQLANIKPVLLTDLEAEFEKLPSSKPVQTRFLHSQQDLKAKIQEEAAAGGDAGSGAEVDGAVEDMDPYDLMDPVEILSKLPKDFYEKCEAKKWQERKEAVEALQQLTSNVKLEAGDYGELVRTLKKIIAKDANVMVVAVAAKCLAGLASGLRKKFTPYAGQCVSAIFEKFKEKKMMVVTALREAIDAIYLTTSLDSMSEDILTSLENKNPQMKQETSLFLARAFARCTPNQLPKKLLKPFVLALIKAINEPDPGVRDAAAEALGTALKVMGEKPIMPFIADVDKIKQDKIIECAEKAELVTPSGQSRSAAGSKTGPPSKPSTAPPPPVKKSNMGAPRPGGPPRSKAVKGGKKGASKKSDNGEKDEPSEKELSPEECEEKASEILSDPVMSGLTSANWKERLAAVEGFSMVVKGMEKSAIPSQVLVRTLCVRKPGLKESNFQVLKVKFELLIHLALHSKVSKRTAEFCINECVDKVGDTKNGAMAAEALSALAEATSLGFVSENVISYAFEQKNPKNQSESLNWLANAVKEFGFSGVNVKLVKDSIKKALSSTNPAVRQSAITLLGVLYMYMGPQLRILFDDEKAALLQQIDAEFDKVKDQRPPAPTRGLAPPSRDADDGSDDSEGPTPVNVADLVPRNDISERITPSLLDDICNKNWKIRNEGLQKLQAILVDAKFINGNIGDLPTALKARLADSNKVLQLAALNIVASMGSAMGPHCKQHVRIIGPSIMMCMGDAKPNIRNTATQALNAWVEHTTLVPLIEGDTLIDVLKNENPFLRSELLTWLGPKLEETRKVPPELKESIPIIYACLEDRNADVRKAANEVLLPVMMHVGPEKMVAIANNLKPTSKSQVSAILEKTKERLPPKNKHVSRLAGSVPPHKSASAPDMSHLDQVKNTWDDSDKESGSASDNKQSFAAKGKSKSNLVKKGQPTRSGKKKDDEDFSPVLVENNGKTSRFRDEDKLKVLRWNFTQPRDEFVQQLKDQMQGNFSTSVIVQLFHSDFKQHIRAIDSLTEAVSLLGNATICNLDLILKWITLRFFDTNPSVLLRSLDYLQNLFNMLDDKEYTLHDLEANSFVPYLVTKIGDPKDQVRRGVRNILHQIYKVYPASKLFNFLMDGLKSKNARQRTECLEELGLLLEQYGIHVCQPSPAVALKIIAQQIGDRDNSVRSAALNTIVQAYHLVGDNVYKYVGHISDKDQSLLDERIKRSARNRAVREPEDLKPLKSISTVKSQPNIAQAREVEKPLPRPKSLILDMEESTSESDQSGSKPNLVEVPDVEDEPIQFPRVRIRAPSPSAKVLHQSTDMRSALDFVMSQVASKDINTSVQALAQIDELLKDEEKCLVLTMHADQLLLVASVQLRMTYSKHMNDNENDVIRLYRCLMATLIGFFKTKDLAKGATRDVLKDLINNLVTVMLDKRLMDLEEGPQVIRSVNVMVVRILEHSDFNNVFGALMKLLEDCVSNESGSSKFTDLITKCLWKVIRMLPHQIHKINLDKMLYDLHCFLKAFPQHTWKDRPSDIPLRTVKTILHSLAKLKGHEVTEHLKLIEDAENSEIAQYLRKVLKSSSSSKPTVVNNNNNIEEVAQQQANGHTANENVKSQHKSRRFSKSAHDMLAEIFKKIGSKENTKEGLADLYDFKLQHPDADIEPFLRRSSQFFQNYIEKGLREIEQDRRAKSASVTNSAALVTARTDQTVTNQEGDVSSDLGASYYREKLKALRARCGLDEDNKPKEALGNSVANEVNRRSPTEREENGNTVSQKTSVTEVDSNPLPESSGFDHTVSSEPDMQSIIDIQKRLERIKQSAIN